MHLQARVARHLGDPLVGAVQPRRPALGVGLAQADWARANDVAYSGFTNLAENPRTRELVHSEIARGNEKLARVEQIKAFRDTGFDGLINFPTVGNRPDFSVSRAHVGQGFVGPFARDRHIAETFFRGEAGARVNDHHVVAERARHRD